MDSLQAVELRTWISREMQSRVSVFELLGSISIAEVCGIIARRSELVDKEDEEV